MSIFQEGLQKAFESFSSKQNNEFTEYIFKPVDSVRYIFRFLEEEDKFVRFAQHSWLPVQFTKNDGTVKEFRSTFFCQGAGCPICKMKIQGKNGEAQALRPQKLMAMPIYIIESRLGKKVTPVNKSYIVNLPAGKSNAIWKQVQDASEMKGTLLTHSYALQRTGKGTDTVWSIQSFEKEDFDYSDIAPLDIQEILKNCGLWKMPSEMERLKIITTDMSEPSDDDISDRL